MRRRRSADKARLRGTGAGRRIGESEQGGSGGQRAQRSGTAWTYTQVPAFLSRPVVHWTAVPALLGLAVVLAISSLLGDSVTFDETAHVASGLSYLKYHDFRLSPEHPPLGKLWCTWPLLLLDPNMPGVESQEWRKGELFGFGRRLLFELNAGQRLVVIARCMMVVLLLATCLTTYALARALFGAPAALLTLSLAALCPTLLAHGRLVTTDLPVTLCTTLTLFAYGHLMRRLTLARVVAAGLALGSASLTKFSWPLVLPVLAVMGAVAVLRREPLEVALPGGWCRTLNSRGGRAGAVLGSGMLMLLIVWLAIWTCYGWRSSMVAVSPPAAGAGGLGKLDEQAMVNLTWQQAVYRPDGTPQPGLMPALFRFLRQHGLLPEAYVVGLNVALAVASEHSAFLLGDYSTEGWASYFPVALLIKTPLATLGLLIAGVAALLQGRTASEHRIMLIGVLTFAGVYGAHAVISRINIGLRHLLPLYPIFHVLGGAAVAWTAGRLGRWLIGGAVLWLLAGNLWIHPHYLAYFNELIGGPSYGHAYLADSNIDWGQDLLRLARYAREHPEESIKLAYFGSAVPTRYLECESLPSHFDFQPRAALTAGTYVVSLTQLLGVYDPLVRDACWTDWFKEAYHRLADMALTPLDSSAPPEVREKHARAAREYPELRARLLLNRLSHRDADARIGYSLFVYRLTDADVEALTESAGHRR